MSGRGIENEDPLVIAERAEKELNSHEAKTGHFDLDRSGRHGKPTSDSTLESGVNESVTDRFEGSTVTYGSAASGQGNNREIPEEEGGYIDKATGKQTRAGDFEGIGGPEDKREADQAQRPGDDDIDSNVRQSGTTAGTTKRPNPSAGGSSGA